MNAFRWLTAASLTTLMSTTTHSQEVGSYYGGLSIGQARSQLSNQATSDSLIGSAAATLTFDRDRSDTGYKLFGGYQLSRNMGIETGYFRLGESGFTTTTSPLGQLSGRTKIDGVNLDLVGTFALTESLSALARIGGQYARTRDNFTGSDALSALTQNRSDRDFNYKVGIGMQYAFSPSMMLRGEVERYRVSDNSGRHDNVDMASLSLVFPFGRGSGYSPRAATPAYDIQATPSASISTSPLNRW